jgi:hypothetical protein
VHLLWQGLMSVNGCITLVLEELQLRLHRGRIAALATQLVRRRQRIGVAANQIRDWTRLHRAQRRKRRGAQGREAHHWRKGRRECSHGRQMLLLLWLHWQRLGSCRIVGQMSSVRVDEDAESERDVASAVPMRVARLYGQRKVSQRVWL